MKAFKTLTGLFLSLIIAASVMVYPASAASSVKTTKKTMLIYNSMNLTFKKADTDTYDCVVTGNSKGYIKVDANNEGEYFWLYVKSKKATAAKAKPVISVYKLDGSKRTLYKKYQITVNPVKSIKFSNQKFNKKVTKKVTLKNPYDKEYKFKYSKKIAKINLSYFRDGNKITYDIKGLKKGSTIVKVYLSGTNKKVGSFKITVGDYKASVTKKKLTLKYNSHMKKSYFLDGGSINIGTIIKNVHSGATYTVKAKNKKLISSRIIKQYKYSLEIPAAAEIYSKKTGKTTLTVYEKQAKAKKNKKIGTIKLTVKRAKDADVYWSNRELDNDGIFYELFISPGESFDLKGVVESRYLNLSWTKSSFKPSEYKFTVTSKHPEIISVDKDGVCHCVALDKEGVNEVTYTIVFADGSKVSGSGSFDVWPADDRPDM